MFDFITKEHSAFQSGNGRLIKKGYTFRIGNGNIFFSVLFLLFTFFSHATNYYVSNSGSDSNAGTSESLAWKTITKVNSFSFSSGDSILFRCGDTWRESLIISSSGTSGSPITFASYGKGYKPKIYPSKLLTSWTNYLGNVWVSDNTVKDPYGLPNANDGNAFFIEADGSVRWGNIKKADRGSLEAEYDWVWVSNYLYIYSPTDPNSRYTGVEVPQDVQGIHLNGKECLVFDNLEVAYAGGYGIKPQYPPIKLTDLIIKNCHIHHIGIRDVGYGIYANYSNTLIQDNEIHDSGRRNISIFSPDASSTFTISNVIIDGNTLYNGSHTTGVDVNVYNSPGVTLDHVEIKNNFIYDDPSETLDGVESLRSMGMFIADQGGASINNVLIHHNIIKYHKSSGVQLENINSSEVYNNTFYGVTPNSTGSGALLNITKGTNCTVRNNIFYNNMASEASGHPCILVSTSAGTVTSDYNLFYGEDPLQNLVYWKGASYTSSTWSAYKSAKGQDINSQARTHPVFTTSTNYDLKSGSPAIDSGVDVGLTEDYAGNTIDSNPDIGAYEYQSEATKNSVIHTTEEISICEFESYQGWTVSGEYERTLTASSGADSIVTTLLTVHPEAYTTENITIYKGESYNGWTESGQFKRTLTSSAGCDSLVTTNLTIEQTIPTLTQSIKLEKGWNIFSSYLIPSNLNMEHLLEDLHTQNQLIEVKDEDGKTYQKSENSWENNIGEMKDSEGYKIRVSNSCMLQIQGDSILLPINIELKTGWNIISFPYNGSVDAMELLHPLINEGILEKVQDEKGNSIENWGNSIGWINGIGNFTAGEGYLVQVNKNDILPIWGKYEKSWSLLENELELVYFKVDFEGNGSSHMNINITGLDETNLQIGDEIAAYDGDICVGAIKLNETNLINNVVSIHPSVSDEDTKNGFTEGNAIELRIWDAGKNEVSSCLTKVINGEMVYHKRGSVLVHLKEKKKVELNEVISVIEFELYPNPASEKVNLKLSYLPEPGISILLSDITGKLLIKKEVKSLIETLDIQTLPSGIYFVKIKSFDNYIVKKLIIQ